MIFMPNEDNPKVTEGTIDDRLVTFTDVMSTLLELCDMLIPDTVDGMSMLGEATHDHIYGECGENDHATRMIRDERFKLISYPVGNHVQLFDMIEDPAS